MIRALAIVRAENGLLKTSDVVVLDHIDRRRRRLAVESVKGLAILLDLPHVPDIQAGDYLKLEDGRLIEVVAAAEHLCEIKAATAHHLMQLAWHLGNRHILTEIRAQALRIKADHLIEDMLRGLGARLRHIEAPFQPQSGAYAAPPAHHHHD